MISYPRIIELFGLPRTGKTTAAHALLKYYQDRGLKVHLNKERASVCPVGDKLSPLFNLWTAVAYLKEYVEATENGCSFVISDRGLLDALVWINSFNIDDKYKREYKAVLDLVNYDLIKENVLLSAFFYADIDAVLSREYGGLANTRTGRVLNERVLTKYYISYRECRKVFPVPIEEVNTTETSSKETVKRLVSLLESKSHITLG